VHLTGVAEMSQNTFCSKCHRIPSQCCCTHLAYINKEDGLVCAKCFKPFTEEWQYLTDDEIKEIIGSYGDGIGGYTRDLFDKIEAKIRKKNETKRTVETR
jgi:hypothetical protein